MDEKVQIESTNFQYLQKSWPHLYEHANFAEQYVYTDPHTSIVKLRCFAEELVGYLYRELNLPCERDNSFFDKLNSNVFIEIIDKTIQEKFHAIRMLGNKAVHEGNISSKDASALLNDAYLIGKWLFKTYSGANFDDYPTYVEPKQSDLPLHAISEENKLLESQLQSVKEELVRLEKSEKTAQNQVIELKKSLDESKLQKFKEESANAAASFDLTPDSTRELIKLDDAFSEYNLTNGQIELVNNLAEFLDSKVDQVFLLKGYAGTGKTFITKGLTEYFRAIGRNYVLAAPTGKASRVIAKKTQSPAYTIHKTIYSFKDIAEYRDDNLDGSETYKFYARLAVNEWSVDTVFIVDEASMIADIYHEEEFFRFGSGYLLRDFFKFINLDHNDHSKKVILIGDNAQLPPVGMNFSPALDEKYLLKEHDVKSTCYELVDVVRQKADSGVMCNSKKLRESLNNGVFNQLTLDLNFPDLTEVSHQDLLPRYIDSCGGKINAESIVLAHSNADVAAYNHRIREHFFPNIKEITSGDKAIAVRNTNAYGLEISNGDFGLVKEVLGNTESRKINIRKKNSKTNEIQETPITLSFREVIIGFKDLENKPHFFPAKILEELLYNQNPDLTSDESKALYIDFCMRYPSLKPGSLEFKQTLMADPYFNALRLKFGYAITCHKSQGSEWKNVFVKCKTNQSQLSANYFRWFYTAITRTSEKLYLIDPPDIKLGSGIKVIGSPETTVNGGFISSDSNHVSTLSDKKDPLNSTDEYVEKIADYKSFGIPSDATLSKEVFKRVNKLIENSGIGIQDVNQGQYQEVYFFQKGSHVTRIDISYDGKDKISSVTAPKQTEFSEQILNLISSLKGEIIVPAIRNSPKNFEFEEDFLNEFHKRLSLLVEQENILINNVESMDWKQRYTFIKSGEVVVFDFFYNGKYIFKNCQPVRNQCSSKTFLADVGGLLKML